MAQGVRLAEDTKAGFKLLLFVSKDDRLYNHIIICRVTLLLPPSPQGCLVWVVRILAIHRLLRPYNLAALGP